MKDYKHKHTDLETEPDYPVSLKCKECGHRQTVSGQEVEYLEIDTQNYYCSDCHENDVDYLKTDI